MAATWGVSSGTVTYKDGSTEITISGLSGLTDQSASEAGVSNITISGTEVTVASTLLPATGTVSVTGGTLKLSGADEYGATTTYSVDTPSNGSAKVKESKSAGWEMSGDNTSATWTEETTDKEIATINLSYSAATGGLSIEDNTKPVVTVTDDAFNKENGHEATTVKIDNDEIALAYVGSAAQEIATLGKPGLGTFTSGSPLIITRTDSAFYSAGTTIIQYTPTNTVELASISGLQSVSGLSLPTEGTEIEITKEMVGSASGAEVAISGDGGYTIKLLDDDDNPNDGRVGYEKIVAQWYEEFDTLNYKSGYTAEGWKQAGSSKITYEAETKGTGDDYKTLTTISGEGLKTGLSVADLNNGGASVAGKIVTLDNSVLDDTADDMVNVTGGYSIAVADILQFDHDASAQDLSVAADGTSGAKITRKQNAGWQDSGTSTITYKGEVEALSLATITGLSAGITGVSVNNAASTVAGKTVIKLDAGALKSGESSAYTVTIADVIEADTVFKGFTLALDGNINTNNAKDNNTVTMTVASGSAIVKKDYAEYWTLGGNSKTVTYTGLSAGAGAEVAKITGLSSTATNAGGSSANVVLGTNKITLKNGALQDADATVTGSYTIELGDGVIKELTDETDDTKVTLLFEDVKDGSETVIGKTAKVNKDRQKYWTVETGKVEFHEATTGTGTTVASLSGLSSTAGTSNVTINKSAHTLTLKAGALKKANATLDSSTYTLADLDGSINTNNAKDNNTVTLSVTGGSATVKKDYAEYWTLGGDSKIVTYTGLSAGAGTEVAKITNLADTADKDTNVILDATNSKITLKDGALKDDDATVTGSYTIVLDDDVVQTQTDETDDTKVTMTVAAAESPATGYVATVKKDQQKYWTVGTGKVEFHAATTGTGTTVATLSGLSTAATDSNVVLDKENKTLKVSKAALIATAGASAILDSTTYSLLTNTDVDKPAKEEGTPTLDDSKLSEGKATYKRTPSAGWTLAGDSKTITYSQPEDVILAEITGLKNDAQAGDITRNGTVITVKKNALDNTADGKVATITTEHGYTFARSTDVPEPAAKVSNFSLDSVNGGKAIIKGTTSAGWKLAADNKTLTYVAAKDNVEVATVEGLNTNAVKDTDVLFNTTTGNITIKKKALKAGNVTLTTDYAKNFNLVLDGANGSGKLGGDTFAYWTKLGPTAEYYSTEAENWTLETDKKTIKYAPLNDTSPTKVATITNLSSDFTLGAPVTDTNGKTRYTELGTGKYDEDPIKNEFVKGVNVESTTITLNKSVLGTDKDSPMTYELAASYTLALNSDINSDGYVRAAAEQGAKFWELGTTAKYKQADLEYWTKNETNATSGKISYSPRGTETLLATITGLKEGLTKDDLTDTANYKGTIGAVTAKGTITLNKNALAKREVNITGDYYKLALNTSEADETKKVAAPTLTNNEWHLNDAHTIATYKADVTEGYEAASDGSSITYTEAATDKTIAEVSGLNGNEKLIVNPTDKQSIGINNGTYTAALSFGTVAADGKKPITLTKDVLGTSNVKVTGTNYTLAIDSDASLTKVNAIKNASTGKVEYTAPTATDVWRVEKGENDSTTAIYKNIIPTFYLIGVDATEITYMPEDTATTYAKVEGLKSGLTVATDGQSLTGTDETGNEVTEVVKLNSPDNKQIDLKKEALGTTDILLDGTGYKLSLENAANLAPAMDQDTLTWSVDSTTAKLNGLLNGGYTLGKQKDTDADNANNKITYTETNPNNTFATLTGLKSGLTNADLNVTTDKPITANFTTPTAPVLTLNNSVLGTTPVELDDDAISAGYTLALHTDVNEKTDNAKVKVWSFKDGTATYQEVTEAYYETAKKTDQSPAATKIAYTGRDESGTEKAKITGLKSGLTAVDGKIEGITPDNESAPTQFTISASVLGTSETTPAHIASNSGNYTFKLDAAAAPVKTKADYWTIDGTTAKYQFDTSAGYTQTAVNADIVYQAARSGKTANTIVEISNLKSGLKKDTVEANINVNEDGTFMLNKNVLGTDKTNPAKLTVGRDALLAESAYNLKLDTTDTTLNKNDNNVGWEKNISDNSYILKQYTPEHWTETDAKTITYTAGKLGNAIAKVTGLKTTLTPNSTTAQIAGITLNPTAHTITLSKSVLTAVANTPAKIETETGADQYSFVLGTDVATPAYSKKWTASKGTATLTETITLGYTGNNTDTITYQPKKTVTTTISGLANTVKATNGAIAGITLKDDNGTALPSLTDEQEKALTEIRDGTFHVDSSLLNNKTVTLTNKSGGGTYQLVLDGATIVTPPVDGQWYKAANATKATYEKRVNTGYVKEDSGTKYTYYSNNGSTVTTLATLNGLTKTVTAAQLNAVITHTAPVEDDVSTTDVDETAPGVFKINSSAFTDSLKLSDIFGKNKLTLASTNYELAFDNDANFNVADIENNDATWTYNSKKGTADLVAGKTEGWAFKTTTKNSVTTTDKKTILYTKAAPKTIASVSGLKSGLTLSADKKSLTYTDEYGEERKSLTASFAKGGGDWVGRENSTPVATIMVSAGVLTNKNVTVTPKQTGYTFAFDVGIDVYEPKNTENYWATDGKGKAFYRYDTSAGYTLGKQKDSDPENANNKITYFAFKKTTLATISGLATAKTVQKDATKKAVEKIERAEQLDGITVTKADFTLADAANNVEYSPGVFTLWDDSILTNKVTLGNKDNYKFAVANEIAIDTGSVENKQAKWYFSNGTATYRLYDTKGYTTSNARTAVFKNETASTTLLTLKGLAKKIDNKPITADKINQENLLLVNEDNTVTIDDAIKANETITLIDGIKTKATKENPATYYQYTIDTNSFTKPTAEAPVWTSVSKGTATLKQTTSAGYTLSDTLLKNSTQVTGQKLTFLKAVNPTIATVKGLATNLAIATETNRPTSGNQTVGAIYTATTEGTGKDAKTTIAGITPVLEYDATNKVITVNKDALATKNVTVSGSGNYKLALGSDITNKTAKNVTEWVVTNGKTDATATYKNYDKAFYALSGDKTIKYTADTKGITYATVKGLEKDTTIDADAFKKADGTTAGDKDGGVLTLNSTHLVEKTITIASNVAGKNTFSLALAGDADTTAIVSALTGLPSSVTANNKGTATIKGKLSKGFTLEFGGKQLTYNSTDNKDVTVATVTGLKKDAQIDVSSGTITLEDGDLANKNVAVTTSWGTTPYKLIYAAATAPEKEVDPNYKGYAGSELKADTPLNPKGKTPGWTISSKNTGTLKGYVTSEGYTLSGSGTTLTYTGKTAVNTTKNKKGDVTAYTYKDTTTLATIKGLKTGLTTDQKNSLINSDKIVLNKANTNGDLTINGGTYAVVVADDYAGKSITGSAGADDLTVQVAGKTITGGKGDDNINITSGGNTLVYNNGDGNDVIANFTAGTDKLQVKSGAISVGKVGTDVVVKVGAGSINLGVQTGVTSIDIYDKNNNKTTYAIAGATTGGSNILLEDNNYSMDAASLSEIVKGDSASFTPYDFSSSFSLTKEDKLTPQISYSGSDKK